MIRFTILFSFLFILVSQGYLSANVNWAHISESKRDNLHKKIIIGDSLTVTDAAHDSAFVYKRGANGLIELSPFEWTLFTDNVSFRDTVIYNPAYLPVVFDGKILPPNLNFIDDKSTSNNSDNLSLIPQDSTFAPIIKKAESVQKQRRDFYTNMNNIESVRYNVFSLKKLPKIDTEEVTKHNILKDLITVEEPKTLEPVELPVAPQKYIYWTYNGEHKIQIAQNYISDNWYKGGNKSFYVVSNQKLFLNYKKDKISFENSFEWRLNIAQMDADQKHKYSFNEDLVRLINILGIKAFNKWEYTARLESQTQLFNSYPINSDDLKTALLSPLTENFAVGMKYSFSKDYASDKAKKLKFSVNLAPVSVNYIFIKDNRITNRQGLDTNEHSKFEIGSMINSDLSFAFSRYTSWTSRLKYYTNYDRVEFEFENNFNMALNRFFSVSANVFLRYDDNGIKDNGWGYFQMNQILSFGLAYKW